jgi:hypothetical protein
MAAIWAILADVLGHSVVSGRATLVGLQPMTRSIRVFGGCPMWTHTAPVPRAAGGNITYLLKNYPADQNGHTVSGSITTDGAIGTLTASDIKS